MSRVIAKFAGLTLIAVAVGAFAQAAAQTTEVRLRPIGDPLRLHQPRAVTSLDIHPGGDTFVSTGTDGTVRLWGLSEGSEGRVFHTHGEDAASARFVREGRAILSTGVDGRAVLSDTTTGRPLQSWQFPTWCLGLAILSSERAAVGCADLRIRIIDLEDGRTEREIQAPGDEQYGYVASLTSARNGRLLASSNPLTLYDLTSGEQLDTRPSFLRTIAFSPDGQTLLGGNPARNAELWEVQPLTPRRGVLTDVEREGQTPSGTETVRFPMPIYSVVWSPDGRHFATGGLDRVVRVFQLQGYERPTPLVLLEGHDSAISALAWSGDRLISGDLGGHIRVWRLDPGPSEAP